MNLYTELQVRKAIELARDTHPKGIGYMQTEEYDYSMDEVFYLLSPIELPSDEIIQDESEKYYDNNAAKAHDYYFELGAKWMRDKIGGEL